MATSILLTIDIELLWRPGVAREDWREVLARSFDPAGVGIPYQLAKLAEHDLRANFFIDPMPALHFGLDPIKRMVEPVLAAGQAIALHLHPQWAGQMDGREVGAYELNAYPEDRQRVLIDRGCELLMAAGAPQPVAFRAGSYAADDATLRAAASLGLRYDLSYDGSLHPWPSAVSLPRDRITPIAHEGVIEIPVTLIGTSSGYRRLQICAVSLREMRAALRHAARHEHSAVTIVGHSFELATRSGRRANRAHVRRFEGLCAFLDDNRDLMPTRFFTDLDSPALDLPAQPLPNNRLRTFARQAEQLWSNFYEERRA